MSFFGQPAKPATPALGGGSSLFGAPAAQNPVQSSSILGGASQPRPFGALSGTTLPGLSTTGQTQPASTSLFGGSLLGQAPKPSLFGGATQAANVAPAAAPTAQGGSFYGTTNPSAGLNQSQAQPPARPTGAYFDSLLARNKKNAEGETALGELPSLQLGLGDLRQRLKKLGPKGNDRPLDGKAHYILAASGVDPGAAVKDLGAFGIQGRGERTQASGGEVDLETYLQNLQTKTTLSMIADGLERSTRDFDAFLEDNVTMEWEAQRKRIYQHFGIKPREDKGPSAINPEKSAGGFGRSRRKSTQPAADRSAQRGSTLGRSAMQKSIIGTPSRIGAHAPEFSDVETGKDKTGASDGVSSMDERFRREKQAKLAEKVRDLNDARQAGQPLYLFQDLAELEDKSGDRHGPYIVEAYRAMMEIVGEFPEQDELPRARQFAKMYLEPSSLSEGATAMRRQILHGANRYLEKQFFKEINNLIAKYPQDANLGGLPDVVSKIKAYIRIRIARKTLVPDNTELQDVKGEYIWAVVFYLLRAGFVDEAVMYVNNNQNHFRSIDRTFTGYINSYGTSGDRRLKRQMQNNINAEYNQRSRNAPENSIDPFRMACYKIIGRCDLGNRSLDGLQTDVNDWVWLQFNLAREGDRSTELANEMYGLAELQASTREIGLKHFPKTVSEDNGGNFGMFFYLQILSGMFEQAIAYLYPFSYVDAVHFAVGLEYYGLLRPSDPLSSGNELLSHSTRELAQINFGRMLGYYTRDFRAANVGAAVDYLVLICLNVDDSNGQQHASLCHEALRELVLETREFSKLIGDIRPDGHRIKGLIEERGSLIALGQEQDFIKAITLQAASFADDNGRTTDAVLLYHLAGDYDTVVSIISRALSEAVSLEIGEDPLRLLPVKPRVEGEAAQAEPGSSLSLAAIDDPVELARTMMTMYERDHMFWQKIRDANRVACSVLLQMSEIKSHVEAGLWPRCLDVSSLIRFPLPTAFPVIGFTPSPRTLPNDIL